MSLNSLINLSDAILIAIHVSFGSFTFFVLIIEVTKFSRLLLLSEQKGDVKSRLIVNNITFLNN